MARVTITPKAEDDLTAIWCYRAQFDLAEATHFLRKLYALLETRAAFPRGAQPCAPPLEGLYTIPFRNVRVFYRPLPDGIDIIRVLWTSQDVNDVAAGE